MSDLSSHLYPEPDWAYDAVYLFNEQFRPSERYTLESPERFGHTRQSLKQILKPFTDYREAVLAQALPLLEQYPLIMECYQTPLPEKLSEDGSIDSLVPGFYSYLGKADPGLTQRAALMQELLVLLCLDETITNDETAHRRAAEYPDLEAFTRLIEKSGLESSFSMLLIRLYLRREDFCQQLFELVDQVIPLLQSHFNIIEKEYRRVWSQISSYRDFHDYMEYVAHFPDPDPDYMFYLSIFPYNTVACSNSSVYHVGLYVLDFSVMSSPSQLSDEQLLTDLKAVGDATRLQILRLLSAKPMYSQELAQALKLTPATISHHLDILRRSNLLEVDLTNEQFRLYYIVNKERIRQISSALLTF